MTSKFPDIIQKQIGRSIINPEMLVNKEMSAETVFNVLYAIFQEGIVLSDKDQQEIQGALICTDQSTTYPWTKGPTPSEEDPGINPKNVDIIFGLLDGSTGTSAKITHTIHSQMYHFCKTFRTKKMPVRNRFWNWWLLYRDFEVAYESMSVDMKKADKQTTYGEIDERCSEYEAAYKAKNPGASDAEIESFCQTVRALLIQEQRTKAIDSGELDQRSSHTMKYTLKEARHDQVDTKTVFGWQRHLEMQVTPDGPLKPPRGSRELQNTTQAHYVKMTTPDGQVVQGMGGGFHTHAVGTLFGQGVFLWGHEASTVPEECRYLHKFAPKVILTSEGPEATIMMSSEQERLKLPHNIYQETVNNSLQQVITVLEFSCILNPKKDQDEELLRLDFKLPDVATYNVCSRTFGDIAYTMQRRDLSSTTKEWSLEKKFTYITWMTVKNGENPPKRMLLALAHLAAAQRAIIATLWFNVIWAFPAEGDRVPMRERVWPTMTSAPLVNLTDEENVMETVNAMDLVDPETLHQTQEQFIDLFDLVFDNVVFLMTHKQTGNVVDIAMRMAITVLYRPECREYNTQMLEVYCKAKNVQEMGDDGEECALEWFHYCRYVEGKTKKTAHEIIDKYHEIRGDVTLSNTYLQQPGRDSTLNYRRFLLYFGSHPANINMDYIDLVMRTAYQLYQVYGPVVDRKRKRNIDVSTVLDDLIEVIMKADITNEHDFCTAFFAWWRKSSKPDTILKERECGGSKEPAPSVGEA